MHVHSESAQALRLKRLALLEGEYAQSVLCAHPDLVLK